MINEFHQEPWVAVMAAFRDIINESYFPLSIVEVFGNPEDETNEEKIIMDQASIEAAYRKHVNPKWNGFSKEIKGSKSRIIVNGTSRRHRQANLFRRAHYHPMCYSHKVHGDDVPS